MWPDGVCRVADSFYTKTVQFQDINYQLSQNEDKSAIFDAWCDFLNYFDSSIRFQFSFLNLSASMESFEQSIYIPPQNDSFDSIRAEYAEMLQNQLGIPNINSGAGMDTLVGILDAAGFGQLNAFCLMVFCLLYVPCAAALATIRKEAGSTKWMVFSALFQLVVAWVVTFAIYRVGLLL